MSDLITAGIGFFGVLLGASIGLFGIRWQHNAQQLQEIRTKGAELIFLGDQFRDDSHGVSSVSVRRLTDPPLPPHPQKIRIEQMRSIVRYLELAADRKTYTLASAFRQATEAIGGSGGEESIRSEAESRFIDARNALLGGLKSRGIGR